MDAPDHVCGRSPVVAGIAQRKPLIKRGVAPRHWAMVVEISSKQVAKAPSGHAASNCTLAPKSVQGVDQATTGMVRPVHVCVGVVFLQPQSTVLMTYQP